MKLFLITSCCLTIVATSAAAALNQTHLNTIIDQLEREESLDLPVKTHPAFGAFRMIEPEEDFRTIAQSYYAKYDHKRYSVDSLRNLLRSSRKIMHRRNRARGNSSARYGFTSLSDWSEQEFRSLLGLRTTNLTTINRSRQKRSTSTSSTSTCLKRMRKLPETYDARKYGLVTSVKFQGACGSCWAFATAATIESAYLRWYRRELDLSEQHLVNCAADEPMSGCGGATVYPGFMYAEKHGITDEAHLKYHTKAEKCQDSKLPVKGHIKRFCLRSSVDYGFNHPEILSDEDIQQALLNYGPLYITINADDLQNYEYGVVNEPQCATGTNHAVQLVGYTRDAWILKNSWGEWWGEDGFMRLKRGTNMCGIRTEILYVHQL